MQWEDAPGLNGERPQAQALPRMPGAAAGRLHDQGAPGRALRAAASAADASSGADRSRDAHARHQRVPLQASERRTVSCPASTRWPELPGVTGARAYSMSNTPTDGKAWHFVERRTARGEGSGALFDNITVGRASSSTGPTEWPGCGGRAARHPLPGGRLRPRADDVDRARLRWLSAKLRAASCTSSTAGARRADMCGEGPAARPARLRRATCIITRDLMPDPTTRRQAGPRAWPSRRGLFATSGAGALRRPAAGAFEI